MRTIEIQEETFQALQSLPFTEALVDTPDTAIRKAISHARRAVEAENAWEDEPRSEGPSRSPRGARTPKEIFYEPIQKVLREAGGELETSTAVDRVEDLVEDQLSPIDYEPLPSNGELRWRNTCRWARKDLLNEGVLAKDSPRGVWRLTESD